MKKTKIEKMLMIVAAALMTGALLAGCMNRDQETPTRLAPSASYMPQGVTAQPSAQPQSFDWRKNSAQIENRIRQISEISDARVVVTGNTALVGVRFDAAYRGDVTERIREMVAAEVMAADPSIRTVAVTADAEDVQDVYELSERSTLGKELDDLKDDVNEIVRNATTLR